MRFFIFLTLVFLLSCSSSNKAEKYDDYKNCTEYAYVKDFFKEFIKDSDGIDRVSKKYDIVISDYIHKKIERFQYNISAYKIKGNLQFKALYCFDGDVEFYEEWFSKYYKIIEIHFVKDNNDLLFSGRFVQKNKHEKLFFVDVTINGNTDIDSFK